MFLEATVVAGLAPRLSVAEMTRSFIGRVPAGIPYAHRLVVHNSRAGERFASVGIDLGNPTAFGRVLYAMGGLVSALDDTTTTWSCDQETGRGILMTILAQASPPEWTDDVPRDLLALVPGIDVDHAMRSAPNPAASEALTDDYFCHFGLHLGDPPTYRLVVTTAAVFLGMVDDLAKSMSTTQENIMVWAIVQAAIAIAPPLPADGAT